MRRFDSRSALPIFSEQPQLKYLFSTFIAELWIVHLAAGDETNLMDFSSLAGEYCQVALQPLMIAYLGSA